MRMPRLAAAVMAVAVLVAVIGCSSDDADQTGPSTDSSPELRQPDENWAPELSRCMQEKGWDVEVAEDGGIEAHYPTDQQEIHRADMEACFDEVGYAMDAPPVSPQDAERRYDQLVEVAECLQEAGYPVPDRPSRHAFVEELVEGNIGVWHPYFELHDLLEAGELSLADFQDAERECPDEFAISSGG